MYVNIILDILTFCGKMSGPDHHACHVTRLHTGVAEVHSGSSGTLGCPGCDAAVVSELQGSQGQFVLDRHGEETLQRSSIRRRFVAVI